MVSALHRSLVDYLAQVINAKNCPTTFYCIFQLVFKERNFELIQRGDPYEKSVLLELRKHTLIFCVVVIGTHTNSKMQ